MPGLNCDAVGIIEVSFFTNAIIILDSIIKESDVYFINWEKNLGGRLVTIIVGGSTSAVNYAIEKANDMKNIIGETSIKVAITISNPHSEILRIINKKYNGGNI